MDVDHWGADELGARGWMMAGGSGCLGVSVSMGVDCVLCTVYRVPCMAGWSVCEA